MKGEKLNCEEGSSMWEGITLRRGIWIHCGRWVKPGGCHKPLWRSHHGRACPCSPPSQHHPGLPSAGIYGALHVNSSWQKMGCSGLNQYLSMPLHAAVLCQQFQPSSQRCQGLAAAPAPSAKVKPKSDVCRKFQLLLIANSNSKVF